MGLNQKKIMSLIRDNRATLKRISVKLLSGKGGKHTHTACVSSPNRELPLGYNLGRRMCFFSVI